MSVHRPLLAFFLVCVSISADRQQQLFNQHLRRMLLPPPWASWRALMFVLIEQLLNALAAIGCEVEMIETAAQIEAARVLIFPGVGSFGRCMEVLREKNFEGALRHYVLSGRPFFGICLGMQTLFEASEEQKNVRHRGVES